jgi:gamma-glutamyl-gamma-aminobutyrate hydrolase PuuD
MLAGGTDVNPELYGQIKQPKTDDPDVMRDEREQALIGDALNRDLPLFAICRGLQMLNVALGGTLIQDLANATDHVRRTPDPAERVHDVVVAADSSLAELIGPGTHPVNSRHHQAIAELSPELRVAAMSPLDKIIEAVEHPRRRFVIGVQWHPEDRIRCEADRRLFESFAAAVSHT